MTRTAPGSICALLLLGVTSCGGSDPGITKAEYLREGNAICSRGNEQIAAVAKQPPPGASADAVATFGRVFVPGIRDQIRQLRALGYPKGDKAELEAAFGQAAKILDRAERDPATIDGHAFDDVNSRLSSYGLTICGS